MARNRKHTRRTPKARPQGILEVSSNGFGFVSTAEGDFFISASKIGGAFDGDLVEIAPIKSGQDRTGVGSQNSGQAHRRPAARVLRVLHRAHESVVGRYEVADPFGVVVPTDTRIPYDIFTMRSENPRIPHGAIVRVRIVEYPTRNSAATGVVEEVLGMEGSPGTDIEALIARYKLETRFSHDTLLQAEAAQVDEEGAFAAGYADERARFAFTIDPFDARDFDDALSIEHLKQEEDAPSVVARSAIQNPTNKACWRLGVHIADVSHYVPWGSAVDMDARKRATSVYLVDRVLPMLPEALSNQVCSLVPGQARRVFTIDIYLSENFEVLSINCHLGVIESKARLSYDQAQCYIDAALYGESWQEAAAQVSAQPTPQGALPLGNAVHEKLFGALQVLHSFACARFEARKVAGGIDFETREAKVQLDEEGRPVSVSLRSRTAATSCVEEAMILANECVAQRLHYSQTPGLFRVHDAPTVASLASLVPILQEFGYDRYVSLDAFAVGSPAALQAVLARANGRLEEQLVSSLLLRAQQRAVYRDECLPHYGLALDTYCHFTSPIRRYPDLVVHRMLRTLVAGKTETFQAQVDSLSWLAEHSSKMERIADEAARESQEMKLAEYMQQFVGQEFEGIVSGVATYGLFVQLDNTAEGLLPVRRLGGEYFALNPAAYKLTGQETGRVFRLGQRLQVRLEPTPEHSRKLEFSLSDL